MRFGLFYEHSLPRPWAAGDEQHLFLDALAQVELADALGYDYLWQVEHHFLEEYSHSSAPEVFLAACSQRTKRMRLGHGIVLMPPPYNHPAKVAARIATLDLVSGGRVEFGTGESSSRMEVEGYGIDPKEKHAMWLEAVEQCANMMVMQPYPGYQGQHFSMPCRNVVPKPVQRPHPPMWMACSNRNAMMTAARAGLGALTFAFLDPHEAKQWTNDYYATFKSSCVPISHVVNPNVATVTSFMCHPDRREAERRSLEGLLFFHWSLSYYYTFGLHTPGRTSVWQAFQDDHPGPVELPGVGSPRQLEGYFQDMEASGVDQIVLVQQAGRTRHSHIVESLERFAQDVMPGFKARAAERERQKQEELAPYIQAAMARKKIMRPIAEGDIPEVPAYGLLVAPAPGK